MNALIWFLLSIAFSVLIFGVLYLAIVVDHHEQLLSETHAALKTIAARWGEDAGAEPPQMMGMDFGLGGVALWLWSFMKGGR